jgi:RimJ/RimL family protein N-acetyltransferase
MAKSVVLIPRKGIGIAQLLVVCNRTVAECGAGGQLPGMTTVIDAGRCILREWRLTDEEALVRQANDRRVSIDLRDRFPYPYTTTHAAEWLRKNVGNDPVTAFAITEPGSEEPLGGVGLMLQEDVHRICAEMGYWLGVAAWGRGIATAAVKAATAYGFDTLGLERIYAVANTRNRGSARVLEKVGYVLEGTMRRNAIKEGVLLDQFMYAALKTEWPR